MECAEKHASCEPEYISVWQKALSALQAFGQRPKVCECVCACACVRVCACVYMCVRVFDTAEPVTHWASPMLFELARDTL